MLLHDDDRIREVDLLTGRELVVGRGQQHRGCRLDRRVRRREPAPDQVVAQRQAALGRRRAGDRLDGVRAGRAGRGLRRARRRGRRDGVRQRGRARSCGPPACGDDDVQVGLFLPELVYAYSLDSSPEGSEIDAPARVTVLGLDGEVGSLDADDSFFYAYPVASGDEHYAVDGVPVASTTRPATAWASRWVR